MILLSFRRLLTIVIIIFLYSFSHAKPVSAFKTGYTNDNKPYKILTAGKQVTVKSTREIKTIMVWTSSGHRVIEEKAVNSTSFSFNLKVTEKVFFIMIQLEGSKPYTEKIGIE
jgi:hypothetical protein